MVPFQVYNAYMVYFDAALKKVGNEDYTVMQGNL